MSTIEFRNSQEAFIHRNIREILEKDGHETADATKAANFAVETYRSSATFGGRRGGKCFEFCLDRAKQCVIPLKKKTEKTKRSRGKAA
ncbi:hypothetical protein BOO36_17020 [Vibrio navarrensis]|uniref:hypothetical protein n=1 Tax=Vibrio navarrensis TaxID=29495 RepID=UPI00186A0871|nr:hypothetical protein [Vibrio navarrensis]MBE4575506.1 hypothetical protein [Vibrio navarrensis]